MHWHRVQILLGSTLVWTVTPATAQVVLSEVLENPPPAVV